MNNQLTGIVDELSVLYELSLSSCSSLDIYENALHFEKTLLSRKNLSSAIYINSTSEKEIVSIAIPAERDNSIDAEDLVQLKSFMEGYDFKVLDSVILEVLQHLIPRNEPFKACYRFDDKSFFIIGRYTKEFSSVELNQLKGVIFQFGNYMNGLFSREYFKSENTKRKVVEKKIRQKNEELNKYIASNLQLENFAHIASHDLKAPLRTIYSFTDLLKKMVLSKLDEKEVKYLDIIHTSSEDMMVIIDNLLAYSKAELMELNMVPSKLDKVVRFAISRLQPMIDSQNAQIVTSVSDHTISIDREEFEKVIYFIMSNSLYFSKPNVQTVIEITSKREDQSLLLEIADNGVGVSEQYQTKVFDMFAKLDPKNRGSGMGLSICKKIIDKHEGEIWMKSNAKGGVSIFIRLPLLLAQ